MTTKFGWLSWKHYTGHMIMRGSPAIHSHTPTHSLTHLPTHPHTHTFPPSLTGQTRDILIQEVLTSWLPSPVVGEEEDMNGVMCMIRKGVRYSLLCTLDVTGAHNVHHRSVTDDIKAYKLHPFLHHLSNLVAPKPSLHVLKLKYPLHDYINTLSSSHSTSRV